MVITFQKNSDNPSTLTCAREDGTTTWTKIYPGLEIHDLAHYVVETELQFREAFYGMVAGGTDIGDYALPREVRPDEVLPANLSAEALQTEHLVNLLQVQFSGDDQIDVLAALKEILRENNIAFPEGLDDKTLASIVRRLSGLMVQWNKLGAKETIELRF